MRDMIRRFLLDAGLAMASALLLAGCSKVDFAMDAGDYFGAPDAMVERDGGGAADVTPGGEGSGSGGNTSAGIVTAGEWRDLDHWSFWSSLMLGDFAEKAEYWKCYPDNLVAVHATEEGGKPWIGAEVVLSRNGKAVWTAKTDNKGYAWCWVSPFQSLKEVTAEELTYTVGGMTVYGHPELSTWNSQADVKMNEFQKMTADAQPIISDETDIAFIVDATGSMGDEIDFLKDDLVDILAKAAAKAPAGRTLRTASVFYRDEGDQYVTRVSDFKKDYKETVDFIKQQRADGGGDYPEAVHTALATALQKLSWGEQSRMRVAFLLLDAPAHHTDEVIASLQKSVEMFARLGIRIVPIAASGADKNTEFMLRFFDILTGGTYTFLTNDSGVGGDHIAASVGEYQVEQLNDLIVRLIASYLE